MKTVANAWCVFSLHLWHFAIALSINTKCKEIFIYKVIIINPYHAEYLIYFMMLIQMNTLVYHFIILLSRMSLLTIVFFYNFRRRASVDECLEHPWIKVSFHNDERTVLIQIKIFKIMIINKYV